MRSAQHAPAGHALLDGGRDRVAALRQIVARVERASAGAPLRHLPLGLPEVDRHLPCYGIARDALHEVASAVHGDRSAAFGFAVALTTHALRTCPGNVLLISARRCGATFGKPYGHGLARLGLDVGRLLLVEARNDREALWAMEEALRSKSVAIVIGAAVGDLNFTMSRRLSLAAAMSGTLLVLLRAPGVTGASAAATRWRIAAAPASRDRFGAFAHPRWRVTLERCRNGRTGLWLLEWDHVALRLRLAQGLADRPSAADAGQKHLRCAG